MSVSATVCSIQYVPNGGTTSFAFPYPYLSQTDLLVTLYTAGVPAVKTLGVDYTCSSTGVSPAGGNVIFGGAPAAATLLVIQRNVPITQPQTYTPNSAFPASATEQALDRLTMICQQLLVAIQAITPTLFGNGAPAIAANPGTLYCDIVNDDLWLKTSATDTTGWTQILN